MAKLCREEGSVRASRAPVGEAGCEPAESQVELPSLAAGSCIQQPCRELIGAQGLGPWYRSQNHLSWKGCRRIRVRLSELMKKKKLAELLKDQK